MLAQRASTGDHQAPSPPRFCEQRGRLAAPLLFRANCETVSGHSPAHVYLYVDSQRRKALNDRKPSRLHLVKLGLQFSNSLLQRLYMLFHLFCRVSRRDVFRAVPVE